MHVSPSLRRLALRLFWIGLFLIGAVLGPFAIASSGALIAGATNLTLISQSDWVQPGQSFALSVQVASPLPAAELGLRFVLYSQLSNRSDFLQSLTGTEPPDELPIDTTTMISVPSSGPGVGTTSTATLRFKIHTTANQSSAKSSLDLGCNVEACPGVYPLEVVLVDRQNGKALSSFTTHLVYLQAGSRTVPLDVALLYRLSNNVSLDPNGNPRLSSRELSRLSSTLQMFNDHPNAHVTIGAYGELLVALSQSRSPQAKGALRELRNLIGPRKAAQLLAMPFAPVDVQGLARNGLGSTLALELARARVADHAVLHQVPQQNPYLSSSAIGGNSVAVLARNGIDQVVLPASAVSGQPNTFTTTAPISIGGTGQRSNLLVGVEDAQLAAHENTASLDPALAAHQFLADLAMIYFEAPFASSRRGVVVVTNKLPDQGFLEVVLHALSQSPIARSVSLSTYFSEISPATSPVPAPAALSAPAAEDVPSNAKVQEAQQMLRALTSVVPSDIGLRTKLNDALLLAYSSQLSPPARGRYLSAPKRWLAHLGNDLQVTGIKTVTLTARTETIPLTIKRSESDLGTVDLVIRAKSGSLAFPTGNEHHVVLSRNDNSERLQITARTSGVSELAIELVSPVGNEVLSRSVLVVHSTVVSDVAIALSVAALAVLLAWWLRSLARHRRQRSAPNSAT